jgi:site-specific DNA-methyltransferase (adenine-specific)
LEQEQYFQRLLIWDKKCGVGSINNGIWYSTEIIAVFNKGGLDKKGIKDFQMSIFSVSKTKMNYQYEHPTQKPIQIMSWLLNHYSNPEDVILDPFMGSGTTGVACQELGRNFIGIEINEKYFKIAERRINQATKELFV